MSIAVLGRSSQGCAAVVLCQAPEHCRGSSGLAACTQAFAAVPDGKAVLAAMLQHPLRITDHCRHGQLWARRVGMGEVPECSSPGWALQWVPDVRFLPDATSLAFPRYSCSA